MVDSSLEMISMRSTPTGDLITSKARQLYQASMDYGCEFVSTGKPPFWAKDPNKLPDLIDFFVVKNVSANYIQIDEEYDLNSDHSPILTISEHIKSKAQIPILLNKYTDWDYFSILLETNTDLSVPLKANDQFEYELYYFTTAIHKTAWKSAPNLKR
jgi:hypothetical protein